MEKIYRNPQMEAKNAPSGSYVAGCPEKDQWGKGPGFLGIPVSTCKKCERTA